MPVSTDVILSRLPILGVPNAWKREGWHSLVLIKAALHGVAKTWRPQGDPPWRYSKAGVITVDLVPLQASQRALIGRLDREQGAALMAALDACNARFGRGAVVPARAGLERARAGWSTKFEMRTPRYTTRIDELPVALAQPATDSGAPVHGGHSPPDSRVG